MWMRLILFAMILIIVIFYNNLRERFRDIPAAIKKRFRDSNQNTAISNINKDIQRRQTMLK